MRGLTIALALGAAALALPASAAVHRFEATLGPEGPGIPSPGSGFVTVTFDDVLHTMRVEVIFADLLSPTIVAHIHAPTTNPGEGVGAVATQIPTFVGFPSGVTAGSYDRTFDMTDPASFNATFIASNGGSAAAAEMALLTFAHQGRAYLNIHTQQFPSGEIRGFLAFVPEPQTWALMILGFGAAGAALRARRRVLAA